VIQIFPCNLARIRGQSLICFIGDETAFWRTEGKDIDVDVLNAARPGLSFPHSKLVKISTPYMMRGEIYNDFKNYYGKANDDVLVFRGSTKLFNPSYPKRKLETMKRRNPATYYQEYESQFRADLSSMYDPQIIDRAVNHDRPLELPPKEGTDYVAFVDVAGGGGKDSFAVSIGHAENGRAVVDLVRSRAPKFNPDQVTEQYSELLKKYGVYSVKGDKFSGDWASNCFSKHGIFYERSEKTKSEIYLECESPLNTNRIEIPNKESLIGKDSVDADIPEDEANVVAGCVWRLLSLQHEKALPVSFGITEEVASPEEKLEAEAVAWLMEKDEKSEKKRKKNEEEDFDSDIDLSEWDVDAMTPEQVKAELEKMEEKNG
jgi:hypothetical protein